MSDYMFMLESHLSAEQNQVVSRVESAAGEAGLNAFLAGGAMRDMLGGFPIRELDFVVEGNPAKLIKTLADKHGVRVLDKDESRRSAELLFANGVRASLAMAAVASYARPGGKPAYKPASIHEDLRGRDFTINSIALSLNRASRGLLLDPTNGLSDLERREIRANGNYTLYDDPARILRMFRFRARMGFELDPRTQSQYENVREAQLETKIPATALLEELRAMADEPNPESLIETLDRERLLVLFSPALTGQKINLAGFGKLQKVRQLVPFGVEFPARNIGLFLLVFSEKMTPKERSQLISHLGISKSDVDAWNKLEPRARKLEKSLKSPRLNRASLVYLALRKEAGEDLLFLLTRTGHRLVHDRIKNHLQKYLQAAQEVTARDLVHLALDPATPKFRKAKEEYILAKIDGRIRKPAPEPEPAPQPPGGPGRPPGGPGRPKMPVHAKMPAHGVR